MFDIEDIRKALQLLEVPKAASVEEVRKAWQRAAIKYHPDKNREADAATNFKERSAAWEQVQKFLEIGGRLPLPKPRPKPRKQPKGGRIDLGPAEAPRATRAGAPPPPNHARSRTVWVHPPFSGELDAEEIEDLHGCELPVGAGGPGFVFGGMDPLLAALFGFGGAISPDQVAQQVAATFFSQGPVCPDFVFGGMPFGSTVNPGNTGWSFGNAPRPAPPPPIHPWGAGVHATPRAAPPPPPGYTRVRTGTPHTHRRRHRKPASQVVAQSVRQAATSRVGPRPHRAPPYEMPDVEPRRKGRVYFEVTAAEMKRFGKETGGGRRPGQMTGALCLPGREPQRGCYDVQIVQGIPVVNGMQCTFRPVKQ